MLVLRWFALVFLLGIELGHLDLLVVYVYCSHHPTGQIQALEPLKPLLMVSSIVWWMDQKR